MRLLILSLSILLSVFANQHSVSRYRREASTDQVKIIQDPIPPPPDPEPIKVSELPLPPIAPNSYDGSCSTIINPRETGCINQTTNLQSGSFTVDGSHILASVEFVGSSSDSIYRGLQIILIKADGTLFTNGNAWECLTCGIPVENTSYGYSDVAYPQAFKDGKRLLAGANILDCGEFDLTSEECTPSELHIYPIHWTISSEASHPSGLMRELRIHPDDIHLAWSSFTDGGQLTYFGRLDFNTNTVSPYYNLTHINLLVSPNSPLSISVSGETLTIDPTAITIGEVRGFSGTGHELTYIGYPRESCNIDVFAINLHTGAIRRLTCHPEYVDPIDVSPDDAWHVVMDTRGSGRQMFLSAMRGVPPLIDLLGTPVVASTRNNRHRRFFQPYLIDHQGDRGSYFGQRVNAAGDGTPGSVNDEDWNGLADPKWSPDGTKIVYHQGLVTAPACGGLDPLPCPNSTADGGRTKRIMLAHLTSRTPLRRRLITTAPDTLPWATPYNSSHSPAILILPPTGTYTLTSPLSGTALVTFSNHSISISNSNSSIPTSHISTTYTSYIPPDFPTLILSGTESLSTSRRGTTYHAAWFSNLTQHDTSTNTINSKLTGPEGFKLSIDILTNIFDAEGWLRSTVDGVIWTQPGNGC